MFHPITEFSTVQRCLQNAGKALDEVGQHYVYPTFDLGVCMKAYPLLWNFPEMFPRHIVMIGSFHLTMAYYNMIGKKMTGSGLSDILMEARLISSGSINGVLSGKNYNRATKCQKVMYESLHRLLIKEFLRQETAGSLGDCFDDEERTLWENLAANLNRENLHLLCTDELHFMVFE